MTLSWRKRRRREEEEEEATLRGVASVQANQKKRIAVLERRKQVIEIVFDRRERKP